MFSSCSLVALRVIRSVEQCYYYDDRVVAGSNPTGAASKLGKVCLPHIACVFRMRHYNLLPVGPFYLVSMPGEVKDPTHGVNM